MHRRGETTKRPAAPTYVIVSLDVLKTRARKKIHMSTLTSSVTILSTIAVIWRALEHKGLGLVLFGGEGWKGRKRKELMFSTSPTLYYSDPYRLIPTSLSLLLL